MNPHKQGTVAFDCHQVVTQKKEPFTSASVLDELYHIRGLQRPLWPNDHLAAPVHAWFIKARKEGLIVALPSKRGYVSYELKAQRQKREATIEFSIKKKHSFGKLGRSWHWFTSERASNPVIVEYLRGDWYPSNEDPVSMEELNRRGWRWHSQVKVPKELRDGD